MRDDLGVIKFKREPMELLFEICFLFYTCASHFYAPGEGLKVYYISLILFLAVGLLYSIFKINRKRTLQITVFTIWNAVFLLFFALSSMWAISSSATWDMALRILQNFIIAFFVLDYVDTDEKMRRVCDYIVVSVLFLVVLVLVKTPVSQWLAGNLGTTVNNRNVVAETEVIGAVICLVLAMSGKQKIYYLPYAIFTVMIMLASSRRSILILIGISAVIIFINSTFKNVLVNAIVIIALAFGIYWAMMNVPALYNAGGRMLETAINHFIYGDEADGSISKREYYIAAGLELFKSKPFLGYGTSSFVLLVGQHFGKNHYSHNNYVEMLVSYGLVGTLIYYFIHIYILIKSLSGMLKKETYKVLATCMIVTLMVAHIGTVGYYSKQEHLFLVIAFLMLYHSFIPKKEKTSINRLII